MKCKFPKTHQEREGREESVEAERQEGNVRNKMKNRGVRENKVWKEDRGDHECSEEMRKEVRGQEEEKYERRTDRGKENPNEEHEQSTKGEAVGSNS